MVDKVITQTQWVDNPRLIGFIQGGRVVARTALVTDAVHDVAENLRNTHTDVEENKPQPRRYDNESPTPHPASKFEYERMKAEEIEVDDEELDEEGPDLDDDDGER